MINIDYLTAKTRKVFQIFSKDKFISDYVLVGGTALSLQIEHRKSEDLDFIFDGENLPIKEIKRNINKTFFQNYKIIKEDKKYQIDFIIEGVKVTFFSKGAIQLPFNVSPFSFSFNKINIAKKEIIAVLKMLSISQRITIRDYYDLYYLAKYFIPLNEIYKQSRRLLTNLPSIVYSETICFVDDLAEESISQHLGPKEDVNKFQIADYFIRELKKIVINI